MKNKTALSLIEQTVMLLAFAFAAAVCLRAFVWSDRQSRLSAARDEAALRCQCAAEVLKSTRGSFADAAEELGGEVSGDTWLLRYDEDWVVTDAMDAPYRLTVTGLDSGEPGLGSALVAADSGTERLFELTVGWQEAIP